jgi:hypothetical protein
MSLGVDWELTAFVTFHLPFHGRARKHRRKSGTGHGKECILSVDLAVMVIGFLRAWQAFGVGVGQPLECDGLSNVGGVDGVPPSSAIRIRQVRCP